MARHPPRAEGAEHVLVPLGAERAGCARIVGALPVGAHAAAGAFDAARFADPCVTGLGSQAPRFLEDRLALFPGDLLAPLLLGPREASRLLGSGFAALTARDEGRHGAIEHVPRLLGDPVELAHGRAVSPGWRHPSGCPPAQRHLRHAELRCDGPERLRAPQEGSLPLVPDDLAARACGAHAPSCLRAHDSTSTRSSARGCTRSTWPRRVISEICESSSHTARLSASRTALHALSKSRLRASGK